MKLGFKEILLLLIFGLLIGCDKEEIGRRDYPRLKTLDVTHLTNSGVTFNAEFRYRGDFEILEYGFVWADYEEPVLISPDKVIFSENIQTNEFSIPVTYAFKPNKKYYVKPFVITEDYTVYGIAVEFSL